MESVSSQVLVMSLSEIHESNRLSINLLRFSCDCDGTGGESLGK